MTDELFMLIMQNIYDYVQKKSTPTFVEQLLVESLDLIKRQKAEIGRLQSKPINSTHIHVDKSAFEECCYNIETAKAEAIEEVLMTLKAEAESSDKFICEYDDSKEQKAYNQALWKAYNLVKELTEGSNAR